MQTYMERQIENNFKMKKAMSVLLSNLGKNNFTP
jgi:hypothetical protein